MSALTDLLNKINGNPGLLDIDLIRLYFEGMFLVSNALVQSYNFDKFNFEYLQYRKKSYEEVFGSKITQQSFDKFESEEYYFSDISQLKFDGISLEKWLYWNRS